MTRLGLSFSILLVWTTNACANRIVHYQGTATDGGRVAYIEQHTVEYDDAGKLLEATTEYVSESGKPLAELKSDFRDSLTVPNHTIKDFRTGNIEGLRRNQTKLVLFDKDEGKQERTRVLDASDADGRILVGCQGLNYYLLDNLQNLSPGQQLPLRFLIPGKLDYYDFEARNLGESKEGIVELEITIQNRLLKPFAPKLSAKFDKKKKRIVWYKGLSNIKSEDRANQNVTISYDYDET